MRGGSPDYFLLQDSPLCFPGNLVSSSHTGCLLWAEQTQQFRDPVGDTDVSGCSVRDADSSGTLSGPERGCLFILLLSLKGECLSFSG